MMLLGCLTNSYIAYGRGIASRQEVQKVQRLEKGVLQIETEYKKVFEAYAKLKAALDGRAEETNVMFREKY